MFVSFEHMVKNLVTKRIMNYVRFNLFLEDTVCIMIVSASYPCSCIEISQHSLIRHFPVVVFVVQISLHAKNV